MHHGSLHLRYQLNTTLRSHDKGWMKPGRRHLLKGKHADESTRLLTFHVRDDPRSGLGARTKHAHLAVGR